MPNSKKAAKKTFPQNGGSAKSKPLPFADIHAGLEARGGKLGGDLKGLALALADLAHGIPAIHQDRRLKKLRENTARATLDQLKKGKNIRYFNGRYRADMPGHDEILSTATVRSLLDGYLKGGVNAAALDIINHVVNEFSQLRIPTHYSGFAVDGDAMQHPTRKVDALFADTDSTALQHAAYDVERRNYVINRMEEAKNATGPVAAKDIVVEGAKAAIEYTLNYFTAPASAQNVFGKTRYTTVTPNASDKDAIIKTQVLHRERLKKIYTETFGGALQAPVPSETPGDSYGRLWPGRPTKMNNNPFSDKAAVLALRRAPSPFRTVPA